MGDFIQELLPNQRGTEVCDGKGNVLGYEDVYEVSDEQLAEEAEQATCEEYLGQSPPLMTFVEVCFLLRAFGKKLGYEVK